MEGRENGSRPEEEEEKREGKCLYCRNLVGGGGREMYDEINKLPNPSLRYYFVPVQSFQEIASEVEEEEEGNDIDKYILTIVVPINARNARRTSGVYTGRSSRRVNTTKEPPRCHPTPLKLYYLRNFGEEELFCLRLLGRISISS